MAEVFRSRVFARWLDGLRDRRAAARIIVRIERLGFGHLGDHKSVGGGVTELRIDCGSTTDRVIASICCSAVIG